MKDPTWDSGIVDNMLVFITEDLKEMDNTENLSTSALYLEKQPPTTHTPLSLSVVCQIRRMLEMITFLRIQSLVGKKKSRKVHLYLRMYKNKIQLGKFEDLIGFIQWFMNWAACGKEL